MTTFRIVVEAAWRDMPAFERTSVGNDARDALSRMLSEEGYAPEAPAETDVGRALLDLAWDVLGERAGLPRTGYVGIDAAGSAMIDERWEEGRPTVVGRLTVEGAGEEAGPTIRMEIPGRPTEAPDAPIPPGPHAALLEDCRDAVASRQSGERRATAFLALHARGYVLASGFEVATLRRDPDRAKAAAKELRDSLARLGRLPSAHAMLPILRAAKADLVAEAAGTLTLPARIRLERVAAAHPLAVREPQVGHPGYAETLEMDDMPLFARDREARARPAVSGDFRGGRRRRGAHMLVELQGERRVMALRAYRTGYADLGPDAEPGWRRCRLAGRPLRVARMAAPGEYGFRYGVAGAHKVGMAVGAGDALVEQSNGRRPRLVARSEFEREWSRWTNLGPLVPVAAPATLQEAALAAAAARLARMGEDGRGSERERANLAIQLAQHRAELRRLVGLPPA